MLNTSKSNVTQSDFTIHMNFRLTNQNAADKILTVSLAMEKPEDTKVYLYKRSDQVQSDVYIMVEKGHNPYFSYH